MSAPRRIAPAAASRRGWCPGLARPMPTGDGLLARLHPPGGVLSPAQARAAAAAARRFGNGHVDVTARANLQIRGVRDETRGPLAAALEAAGLGDTRHDGGPQRLTLTHPLAGLDPAEGFDVVGIAQAVEARGLAIGGLPPKTLVAIEGLRWSLGETGADLLVRACGPDHAAIGLAAETGLDWIGRCPAPDIAAAIGAILTAFARTGRRRVRDLTAEERGAAVACLPSRDRDLSHRSDARASTEGSGPHQAFRSPPSRLPRAAAPQDEAAGGTSEPASGGAGLTPRAPSSPRLPTCESGIAPPPDTLRAGLAGLSGTRVAVVVEAPFGRCGADGLDRLADIADMIGSPEIRLAPTRGFVLAASDPAAAEVARAALAAHGFLTVPEDPRRAVAACPGAPACASGSTPTLADAARLAAAFAPFAARGLTAHVSGCPKGCAHPAAADLTLVGANGRYGVVLGGTPGAEPAMQLTFEAALERVRRADSALGLDHAFRT